MPLFMTEKRARQSSAPARASAAQLALRLERSWGGRRAGAGRPPLPSRRSVAHRSRPRHYASHPVHVTLRVRSLPPLREQVLFAAIRTALSAASKSEFRLLQFSVQRDHLHLIVEGTSGSALSRGVQGLCVRVAR